MPAPVTGSRVEISLSSRACSAVNCKAAAVFGPRGRLPAGIHQHNIVRSQAVHGRSDQIADGIRLAIGQRTVTELDDHRGLGLPFLIAKQRVVGHYQVNPGRLDIGEGAHGVFEFAFESALVVDLFVEFRAHPIGFVEDLKAHAAALDAPLGGGCQAGLVQLGGGNANASAVRGGLEGNLGLGEHQAGLAGVFRVHARVENAPVGSESVPE